MCPSVKSYLSKSVKLYVVTPFSNVLVSTFSPSLSKLIVIVGWVVPSGSTHIFVPLTSTFAWFIVFVKFVPFWTVVYPSTATSSTVYTLSTPVVSLYLGKFVNLYELFPFTVSVFPFAVLVSVNSISSALLCDFPPSTHIFIP